MKTQKKDLTVSQIDRQNILNNPYALQEIERATKIKGILFEGRSVVLKEQVAKFFDVTLRTIENYLEKYEAELSKNGYVILRGERLKTLKKILIKDDVHEIDFGNISKTPQLAIFDFRAFLNLAMLQSRKGFIIPSSRSVQT
jgi:transcriptional antiterminator